METARCSECLGEFRVRADGMIRYHGPHPKPCPGGGKPPAVMHAGWMEVVTEWLAEVSRQPLPPPGQPATREGLARRAREYASRHDATNRREEKT